MKRFLAPALGAVLLVTTALTGGSAQAEPGLTFGACPEDIRSTHPRLQCAPLSVPLDHRAPGGERIQLLVSKSAAREPAQRRGVLLVNPGGPGEPGAAFAGSLAQALPPDITSSYDLIGFDTRHSRHSTPITCVDPATYWKPPLPDPDSPATRGLNWQRARQYADGCQQRAGKYLPHLTTRDNARDMELIRTALGTPKINFLGYSYGTYLGAVYGELFPDRVDRMILDSAVNPSPGELWYGNNLRQDVAAQKRLHQYFDWIARHDAVFHLGTDREQVRTAWQGVLDDLRTRPRDKLGPSEFLGMSMLALYGESEWTSLAQAIGAYRLRGDHQPLVRRVKTQDEAAETSQAIYTSVECADAPWPTRRAEWEQDVTELAKHSPMVAWYNSWTVAPCATWHGPQEDPLKITGQGLPPLLIFNSVHDLATPYQGALEMHGSLPSSVLVTEQDSGKHGVFGISGHTEANRIGTDYLVRGVVPQQNTTVAGHSLPNPAAQESGGTSPAPPVQVITPVPVR